MNAPAKLAIALSVALLGLSPGHALATPPQQATVGQVNGTAMKSTDGGQYVTLNQGAAVNAGDSISVSQGGSVTLNVTNGTNTWQVTLPPGTTTVTSDMLMASAPAGVAVGSGASVTATVATVIGAAVVAAAAIESNGDSVPPIDPVSP